MSKAAGFFLGLMMIVAGGLLIMKLSDSDDSQQVHEPASVDTEWSPQISPADYKTGAEDPWIQDFELVDQQGELFRSADLKGKVWMASFFFSSCPSTCVQQNREVQSLHEIWARKGINFISITCDAENDTPVRLHEYAQNFTKDTSSWKFLSGDGGYINRIGSERFMVSVGPRTHTESFLLVDKWGNVRGTYNWQDTEEMKTLNQQFVTLLTEEQEPAEWVEKRKILEEQISQFNKQQENGKDVGDETFDMTNSENQSEEESLEEAVK